MVIPGFVDVHVHLREPGFFHKETIRTGIMAAASVSDKLLRCRDVMHPAIHSQYLIGLARTGRKDVFHRSQGATLQILDPQADEANWPRNPL